MNNLFVAVMEAEGNDLQPFSEGPENSDNIEQSQPDTNDQMDENPPPLNEDAGNDLAFGGDGSDDMGDFVDDSDNDYNDTDPNEDKKNHDNLSEKANNILNQQLYEQMISYNNELDSLLDSLQTIIPVLPYETVKYIDKYSTKLQETLETSKDYVVNKFVNVQYGENLLFFEKVKSLCSILKDQINKSLKQIEKH